MPEELPTQWQLPRSWGSSEVELLQVGKGDVPPEQKSFFRHKEKGNVKLVTFALLDGGVGGLLGKYTTAMRKVRMAGTDKRSR